MFNIYMNGTDYVMASYEAGEAAELRIPLATDCETKAFCDEMPLPYPTYEDYSLVFRFEMPPCDLHIKIVTRNTMVYRVNEPTINFDLMPDFGMMGVDRLDRSKIHNLMPGVESVNGSVGGAGSEGDGDCSSDVSVGTDRPRPKFCPDCGEPLEAAHKFCRNCGRQI